MFAISEPYKKENATWELSEFDKKRIIRGRNWVFILSAFFIVGHLIYVIFNPFSLLTNVILVLASVVVSFGVYRGMRIVLWIMALSAGFSTVFFGAIFFNLCMVGFEDYYELWHYVLFVETGVRLALNVTVISVLFMNKSINRFMSARYHRLNIKL